MKSDLKDCSCLISQMRQVRGDAVEGQEAVGAGLGVFLFPSYKPQGNIQRNGGKDAFQVNKQKYALYIRSLSPSSIPGITAGSGAGREEPGLVK